MNSLTGLARPRTCDQPDQGERCQERLAAGYNPLGLCAAHLALYRDALRRGGRKPTPLGALAPVFVLDFGAKEDR